jgi:predicted permease
VLQPYQLAAIAAEPVVKVALLSGAGALCAKRGILTLEGRRMLSGLIMNVFTPALVSGSMVLGRKLLRAALLSKPNAGCQALYIYCMGWTRMQPICTPLLHHCANAYQ